MMKKQQQPRSNFLQSCVVTDDVLCCESWRITKNVRKNSVLRNIYTPIMAEKRKRSSGVLARASSECLRSLKKKIMYTDGKSSWLGLMLCAAMASRSGAVFPSPLAPRYFARGRYIS